MPFLLGFYETILGGGKIEAVAACTNGTHPTLSYMSFSAFARKPVDMKPTQTSYRTWKQKEKVQEVKIDSVNDFPELVQAQKKQTVFEGMSLASKLKEVLVAEEEAAIQKRLKKGVTPEQILREGCVVLPLKSLGKKYSEDLIIPDWVLDHTNPVVFPSFRPKSLEQLHQERYWKRLGINPTQMNTYDEEDDDDVSVVSMPTVEGEDESSEEE